MEENIFECNVIHNDLIKKVKDTMPNDELIFDIAELFKVFGDSTRMKIIYALMENELCVCDLCELLGLTQSNVSHQLQLLFCQER